MTLKQWLDSYADKANGEFDAGVIAAFTEAYYRDQATKADAAFTAAFLKMQPEIPIIDETGEIVYRDGRKGTYAQNEDIQAAIGPILQRHGFSLTFETSYPREFTIRVEGVLRHRRGHERRSAFESTADTSGGKTVAQSRGSILSYGHRYTTVDLLNIQTRGIDDDGRSGLPSRFDPTALSPDGRAAFAVLLRAACDSPVVLAETWRALSSDRRASVTAVSYTHLTLPTTPYV